MLLGGVLAALPRSDAAAVVRDGARTVLAFGAADALVAPSDPFAALDALDGGWWSGYAAYELGHAVERVVRRPTTEVPTVPDLALVRFAARAAIGPDGSIVWSGTGPRAARSSARSPPPRPTPFLRRPPASGPAAWTDSTTSNGSV